MGGPITFNIREYVSQDLKQVQAIFASGLIEFAGENAQGVRRYVARALKDDMADIPSHYQAHPRGNFWVAECSGALLGHVGIQPTVEEDEAELRRMSVSSTVRGQGIGRRLLEKTEDFCRSRGYNRIILSTADFLKPALAMYQNNGYTLVKIVPYGAPPNDQVNIHHLVKDLYPIN